MGRSCAVPGCHTRSDLPKHKFPKSAKVSELWAKAIKNLPLLEISTIQREKYTVCYKHFPDSAYRIGKYRRLFEHIIPSLCLPDEITSENIEKADSIQIGLDNVVPPAFTNEVEINTDTKEEIQNNANVKIVDTTRIGQDILLTIADSVPEHTVEVSSSLLNACSTYNVTNTRKPRFHKNSDEIDFTPKGLKMYEELKKLMKKQKSTEKRKKTLKERLKSIRRISKLPVLTRYAKLSEGQKLLINAQLKTLKYTPQERHYTVREKIFCLRIYRKSPQIYKLLQNICSIPKIQALKKVLRSVQLKAGLCNIMLQCLEEETAKLSKGDRYCILMWDEMTLEPHINYNSSQDRIIGIEDWGTNRTCQFAHRVLVFMLRGIRTGWIMPISYNFYENQVTASQLVQCIEDIIEKITAIGLKIIVMMCNQEPCNIAVINHFINSTIKRKEKWSDEHRKEKNCRNSNEDNCINLHGVKIFPLYDPLYLIKAVRDNLLISDLEVNIFTEKHGKIEGFASWRILEMAYNLATHLTQYPLERPLLQKVTEEHIVPRRIKINNVKYATEVFTFSSVVSTQCLALFDTVKSNKGLLKVPKNDCLVMTKVLHFFATLLNSFSGYKLQGKEDLQCIVTRKSEHHKFWASAVKELQGMRYVNSFTRVPVTGQQCLRNWTMTIQSVQQLWEELYSRGFRYLRTGFLNKKSLDDFFNNIRVISSRNNKPTCMEFSDAYKILLMNNLSSRHDTGWYSESDYDEKLLFTFKKCVGQNTYESVEHIDKKTRFDISNECVENFSNTGMFDLYNSKNYIVKQIIEKNPHKQCDSCVSTCKSAVFFINAIPKMYKVLYKTIYSVYFRYNISELLMKILRKRISFDFIQCDDHFESLRHIIVKFVVITFIRNWCKNINKILTRKGCKKTKNLIMKRIQHRYNFHL